MKRIAGVHHESITSFSTSQENNARFIPLSTTRGLLWLM